MLGAGVDTASARTYVTKGSFPERAVYRPTAFVGGSGVGGGVLVFSNMHWSSWGSARAIGQGTLTYNTCEPFCASGNMSSVRATVRLSAPRDRCRVPNSSGGFTRFSVAVFTKLTVTYAGAPVWRSLPADTQYCQ
jgi:hypothetical protein